MPLQIEAKVALLDFIPDPTKRLEVVQKTQNPPKFSNLAWLIEVFRNCAAEDGWLDANSLRKLVDNKLIMARFVPTGNTYIGVIEKYTYWAMPQLLLPVPLEVSLYTRRISTVGEAGDFAAGRGRWERRDFSGARDRLLQTEYLQNGHQPQTGRFLIENKLAEHRQRLIILGVIT